MATSALQTATGHHRDTPALLTYPLELTVLLRLSRNGLIRFVLFRPLDQVFRRRLPIHELHTGPQPGSDHLPFVFSFSIDR